ncbi:hypothetical protein LGH82_25155 [Mesorhizobium sp. PAMC28654]|uniref:hypothetical protein n=1 Tax=Mesorhizobium sp. PAMC28654 TaxID=2880934 RepID=UPI001D0B83DE|nr:hypothetical protein [Mesorhizobium sp. PAMC28654]UDL88393.1 hypothetical protein LGH82_25155 [Mesorhizobium sp. PAMC28654]
MTSTNQQPARPPGSGLSPDSGLSYVPPGWVVFVMAWSVYGLVSFWPMIGAYDLPDSVFYLIYSGLIANIVTILWGLYLLGLAFGRSSRFPRHFTIWQVVTIVWLLARQAYVLAAPHFVFSARGLVITAIEIAVGLLCIYLLRRGSGAELVYSSPEAERPSVLLSVVAAILGIILGAAVGAVAGFAAGSLIADATSMSCFEGGCGYFALLIGLGGLVIGAIVGGVFAVWRVNRRKRRPVA